MVAAHHSLRIAIAHDALVNRGGAERVVTFMHEAFPEAPIYTSAYLPDATFSDFRTATVRTLPGANQVHDERRAKQFLPLWIAGFRMLDLSRYDVVLSSTTFAAKYCRAGEGKRHVSYCYAPFRFAWKPQSYSRDSLPLTGPAGLAARVFAPIVRQVDRWAMKRIDALATSCVNMANEIRTAYGREADVIYPPIRICDYTVGSGKGEYYLTVSRLISHKRVDLAIEACERLKRRLIVVGDGPERSALEQNAGGCTTFAGAVSDVDLRRLYSGCRALIFPSHEDYGLTPLEAQASGRPVLAFGQGGVLETVMPGETGVFFPEQTVDAVIDAIHKLDGLRHNPEDIRRSVTRFDVPQFIERLRAFVGTT